LRNLIRRLAGVLARPLTAARRAETASLRCADVSTLRTAVPGKICACRSACAGM